MLISVKVTFSNPIRNMLYISVNMQNESNRLYLTFVMSIDQHHLVEIKWAQPSFYTCDLFNKILVEGLQEFTGVFLS